jgi:uncharacterized protein with HEPN domain
MTLDRTPAHLCDMLDFVRELRALLQGLALRAYLADRVLTLAVEKLFINLGEAATRLEEPQRAKFPHVPWRQIIGLRNILAHGYEQVDHETLYRTVTSDLAAVELALVEALALVTSAPPR